MLGASGIQVGKRFLTAFECGAHKNYKNKVIAANDVSTIVTGKRLGHPVRSIKTPFTRKLFEYEYSDMTNEELEKFAEGSLRLAAVEGDVINGSFMAGQIAAIVKKEQPAHEIITEICEQAEKVLLEARKWIR